VRKPVLTRRTKVAAVLVVAASVWALVNKPFEIATLLVLSPTHGITVGDLPSIAALIVAVLLVLTQHRS
jgi:hypothetical protein